MHTISSTLRNWADNIGMDWRTLKGRLLKSGFVAEEVEKKGRGGERQISAKDIFTAVLGDTEAEKRRLMTAQAEKIERENALEAGQIATREGVIEAITPPLLHIADAWKGFDRDTGAKMEAVMLSAGVKVEIAKQVRDMARESVEKMAGEVRGQLGL